MREHEASSTGRRLKIYMINRQLKLACAFAGGFFYQSGGAAKEKTRAAGVSGSGL